jgi:hypothetical protein
MEGWSKKSLFLNRLAPVFRNLSRQLHSGPRPNDMSVIATVHKRAVLHHEANVVKHGIIVFQPRVSQMPHRAPQVDRQRCESQ